jgi:hypothetical protein
MVPGTGARFFWRAAPLSIGESGLAAGGKRIRTSEHIVIGLPLNRLLIPRAPPPVRASGVEGEASPAPRGAMAILAFVFAATIAS